MLSIDKRRELEAQHTSLAALAIQAKEMATTIGTRIHALPVTEETKSEVIRTRNQLDGLAAQYRAAMVQIESLLAMPQPQAEPIKISEDAQY